MKANEAFDVIGGHHTDELVVNGIGSAQREWHRVFGAERDESLHNHAMGITPSVGLGLALTQPSRRVWVFDGDGSLVMSFGVMLTLAALQPVNMALFIVSNRHFGVIGESPIVNHHQTDYVAIAKGAGIAEASSVSDVESLDEQMKRVIALEAFQFVVLEVENPTVAPPPLPPYEGAEIKYRFGRYIERTTATPVFGPEGF